MKAWPEKRGRTWRVRYERPDGGLGSISGFENKTAAENKIHNIKTDTTRGKFRDPGDSLTLGEWIEIWRESHHASDNTWAKYNSHLENHILRDFRNYQLTEIKRMHVKRWLTRLRKHLALSTIHDILSLLAMIMSEAAEDDLIDKTPCRKLSLGVGTPNNDIPATPKQINRIATRCRSQDATLIITAAYTGMRWSELTGLQWHNVNLDNATITIDKDKGALHEIRGRLELGPPKTPSSARTVHLPPFLVDLLRQHRDIQRHENVFTGPDDTLLRRSNFRRRVWRPAVAGDPTREWAPILVELKFHGLRHTHRTWLTEDRVHEVLIFNRMGWLLGGVRGIYDHATQPMVDSMLATLQERWNASRSERTYESGSKSEQTLTNPKGAMSQR